MAEVIRVPNSGKLTLGTSGKKGTYKGIERRRKIEGAGKSASDANEKTRQQVFNQIDANNNEFVHQTHVIEDPEVIMRRRTSLPEPTADDKWKKPMSPFFEPLKPFVDVKDFPKDPDVKQLKPATIPRWKDFMQRSSPMVPRTWY